MARTSTIRINTGLKVAMGIEPEELDSREPVITIINMGTKLTLIRLYVRRAAGQPASKSASKGEF